MKSEVKLIKKITALRWALSRRIRGLVEVLRVLQKGVNPVKKVRDFRCCSLFSKRSAAPHQMREKRGHGQAFTNIYRTTVCILTIDHLLACARWRYLRLELVVWWYCWVWQFATSRSGRINYVIVIIYSMKEKFFKWDHKNVSFCRALYCLLLEWLSVQGKSSWTDTLLSLSPLIPDNLAKASLK